MRYDTLSVKDFERFQHYKDRAPKWIKLYNRLLEDYEFAALPDQSKAHLILIWLLASRLDNRIPNDAKWVQARIGAKSPVQLEILIDAGYLVQNRTDLYQNASSEERRGEREESRTDTPKPPRSARSEWVNRFPQFWSLWPRKVGKVAAEKAWKKLTPTNGDLTERWECVIDRLNLDLDRWQGKEDRFIPHASTWLNNEAFDRQSVDEALLHE